MLGLKKLVCTLFSDKPGFVVFFLLRGVTGYCSSKDSDDWFAKDLEQNSELCVPGMLHCVAGFCLCFFVF